VTNDTTAAEAAVLSAAGLAVTFPTDDGEVRAVRGVSFTLGRGETIGVAMLGLLPRSARITGSVRCQGKELIGQPEKDLAKVRSSTIAYIPQDPLTSLNPAFTVGRQVAETIWTRGHVDKEEAHKKAVELLELVGIPNAARRVDDFPHEFSGGQRQRIVIAIAMANDPVVMIADEPTTALDVTIQAQVLDATGSARR
jgi:ABC-type glutathione transport system ATPase component